MSKKIAIRDFYDFTFLSDVSYSPDGKKAVFLTHQPDEEQNLYKARLWLYEVDTGAVKPMTAGCKGGKHIKQCPINRQTQSAGMPIRWRLIWNILGSRTRRLTRSPQWNMRNRAAILSTSCIG